MFVADWLPLAQPFNKLVGIAGVHVRCTGDAHPRPRYDFARVLLHEAGEERTSYAQIKLLFKYPAADGTVCPSRWPSRFTCRVAHTNLAPVRVDAVAGLPPVL